MKTNEVQFLSEAGKTQAKGLKTMMAIESMRQKGWEIKMNAKGEVIGKKIRHKEPVLIKSVFAPNELIKGKKAYYSKEFFCVSGIAIYERETLRFIDTLSA